MLHNAEGENARSRKIKLLIPFRRRVCIIFGSYIKWPPMNVSYTHSFFYQPKIDNQRWSLLTLAAIKKKIKKIDQFGHNRNFKSWENRIISINTKLNMYHMSQIPSTQQQKGFYLMPFQSNQSWLTKNFFICHVDF